MKFQRSALGAQIISLNASPFRGPPSSEAQQSAAAIIATSFIPSQCARPGRESRCGCSAKTNLLDKESSSPERQKKKEANARIYLNYTRPRRGGTLCRKRRFIRTRSNSKCRLCGITHVMYTGVRKFPCTRAEKLRQIEADERCNDNRATFKQDAVNDNDRELLLI